MSFMNKRRILNGSVYIALALVVAAVIAVTAVTFVNMRRSGDPPETTADPQTDPTATGAGLFEDPTTTAAQSATPAPTTGDGKTTVSQTTDGAKNTHVVVPTDQLFCLPADGVLLKEYSAELPVRSLTMNDYRTHAGIDISAPAGTAVKAAADGTVFEIWSDPMMGMCLSIDHGGGLTSIYRNLDTVFPDDVVKGAPVRAGQTVACVGNTCLVELADVDHLHFEMTFGGKHVDPGSYIDLSKLAAVEENVE